jgi:hypothetical protein
MNTRTNLKGLPDGVYFTERGYTQSYPWVQIKRTDKTATIAKVLVGPDPDWHPEIIPGGFAGHCTNQRDQTWLYAGVDLGNTRRIRLTRQGWMLHGTRYAEDRAIEFYDYNF